MGKHREIPHLHTTFILISAVYLGISIVSFRPSTNMSSQALPPLIAFAAIKTPTKEKHNRFREIFTTLVDHCRANEPETRSYYFFTSTADDHTLYGFEAYPTVEDLVDVHSKSEPFVRQSGIVAAENLATVDVDQLSPLGGFILRDGQKEEPVARIVMSRVKLNSDVPDTVDSAIQLAKDVEAEEKGCSTFVAMQHRENGSIWTFERYVTEEDAQKVKGREAYIKIFGEGERSEFDEANIGF